MSGGAGRKTAEETVFAISDLIRTPSRRNGHCVACTISELYMPIPFLDLVILLLAAVAVWLLGSAWLKYRGQRVIMCPENHRPAGVVLDAGRAAAT